MKPVLLLFAIIFSINSWAVSSDKRLALRALDTAYNSVAHSEDNLDYQAIIDLANEITAMTEGQGFVCAHEGGGWYHLVDRQTGRRISSSTMNERDCNAVIEKSKAGLICAHEGGGWYHLYDLRVSEKITSSTTNLPNCVAAIESSKNGLVCTHQGGGWYHLYDRVQKKNLSGSTMPFGECERSIR